jgi:hypothetical protein
MALSPLFSVNRHISKDGNRPGSDQLQARAGTKGAEKRSFK